MEDRAAVRKSPELMGASVPVTFSSHTGSFSSVDPSFDSSEYSVLPGFCDVHVHFREPGFSYKETIRTGSSAAAHGGYTAVCTMPNLNPVPDSLDHLKIQKALIDAGAVIPVYPYGALTVGEMGKEAADLDELAPHVIAFSDDGKGVQDDAMMEQLMLRVKGLHKILAAHCEDERYVNGGYIHTGAYADAHAHRAIPSDAEWRQVERDLHLAARTGCAYHVCHISTKESVRLIRDAKKAGVDVTCETAPHYLVFTEQDLREEGRFKMNPPLAELKDREALIEGLLDGTIDMISTDHAPHSDEEKSRGLKSSPFGVVGLETAFPALYTHLVRKGIIDLQKLMDLMAWNPRRRFGIPEDGYSLWKLNECETVDPSRFLSRGHATPFAGTQLYGVNYLTVAGSKIVYQKKEDI